MSATAVTSTTADKFINDVWSPELNRAVEFDTIISALFDDKSKVAKQRGGGQVFHLPARHNLTANTKAATTDATPESITETEQTFTPSTHQIVAQEIENFAEVMSMYDIRSEYTMAASYALARAQDVACAALFDDNTTQTVGTIGSELSDDDFLSAWVYLRNSSAKAPYKVVLSPAGAAGLLKIDKYIRQEYNGDSGGKAVHDAQVGKIYQASIHISQLTVGTAPNSDGHMWSADHFFKIIKKAPKQDAWFSPLAKSWVVATDQIYGVFERQEADEAAAATTTARLWGVRLRNLK